MSQLARWNSSCDPAWYASDTLPSCFVENAQGKFYLAEDVAPILTALEESNRQLRAMNVNYVEQLATIDCEVAALTARAEAADLALKEEKGLHELSGQAHMEVRSICAEVGVETAFVDDAVRIVVSRLQAAEATEKALRAIANEAHEIIHGEFCGCEGHNNVCEQIAEALRAVPAPTETK